jgi:hypothetical protein
LQALRALRTDNDLARATRAADLVVVGRKFHFTEFLENPPRQTICFGVSQTLKELPPGTNSYPISLVSADFPPEVGDLLYPEDRDFIVFLKLTGIERSSKHPAYDEFRFAAVPLADGLVEADAKALAVVRASVAGLHVAGAGREWEGYLLTVGLAGLALWLLARRLRFAARAG